MRRIKGFTQERRWRKQDHRGNNNDRCPNCRKLRFRTVDDAEAKAEVLTRMHRTPHYVYEAHGQIHLTTHPHESN